MPGSSLRIAGAPGGPLAGLTFAAKDLFDVAGHPTGGGNPDWARQNAVPTRHAWAVQRLLDVGATLIGKTITDEVSLGILGENPFDGTPLNPKAPERVPGGSSSGSASAVAQALCDTALGTDTGGSVRVPASFCGLYGIRPTHGRLDLTGMLPQAPSSDTTGWFARDADTLARVSEVLLGEPIPARLPTRLVVAVDGFGFADAETAASLQPMVGKLAALVPDVREDLLAPPGCRCGRGPNAPCSPTRAGSRSRIGSIAITRACSSTWPAAWPSPARSPKRAAMGGVDARGGACPPRLAAPARNHSVPADHTVPRAPEGALARDTRPAARADQLSDVPRRPDRGAEVSLPGATVDGLPVGLSFSARAEATPRWWQWRRRWRPAGGTHR